MRKQYDIEAALQITKKLNQSKEKEGGEKMAETDNRRSLFLVVVVDPKTAAILVDKKVIAKDQDEAKLKAVTGEKIGDLDKVDIGSTCLIKDFIRPRKETQKVQIAKEGEDDAH